MNDPSEIDTETLISIIAGSNGDTHLAAERLSTKLGFKVTGYDIEERLANIDVQTSDRLASKLRTLLTVRLYNLIHQATVQLAFNMDSLRPSELAKTHSALVNSFTSLTAPATKVQFDFDSEVAQLAEELQIPADEIRTEIKSMQLVAKTGFGTSKK
jgi:hypothetical protein